MTNCVTFYSPLLSFKCCAEFDHDPQNLSTLNSASAVSSELAHIMQGSVRAYPASQHLPIAHESSGRGLSSEYDSLGFNELSDFWEDLRLYSQEMPTRAVLPPQKLGWNEGSTSCTTRGDPMSTTMSPKFDRPSGLGWNEGSKACTTSGDPMFTTISTEFDSPPGQRSCSYQIPIGAETLALPASVLECPRSPQGEKNHLPWQVATSLTSLGFDSTLVYHGSPRQCESDYTDLPPESSRQPEILVKTLSPAPQLVPIQKSGFHSQSLQDAPGVEHFSNAVDDSKVTPGSRQLTNLGLQQRQSLLASSSPVLHRHHQPEENGIGGKAQQLRRENQDPPELKQKSKKQSFALRKYQRRRIVDGNDMKVEVSSVPKPLDHVQRERHRRDVMTSKIAALELLLPKSSKRDRVSVVYDAIHLLKRLERDVKDLQKKFHVTKLRKASLASSARHGQTLDPAQISIPISVDANMRALGHRFSNEVVIKRLGTYMKPVDIPFQPKWNTNGKSRPAQRNSMVCSVQCLGDYKVQEKESVLVEFHVHLDDNVLLEEEKLSMCRCRKDYLSTMMGLANEFQLDVISCNIVKLSGYFICVVGLKTGTTNQTTAAQFARRLQSAVDVDIAREAVTIILSGAKISDSLERKTD